MRDKRFIAQHRGGGLGRNQHKELAKWALQCAENVLVLCDRVSAEQLKMILDVGRNWIEGRVTAGDARKASITAISIARNSTEPTLTAAARAAGHAVATAHMADHSVGAALYALKAVKMAGKSVDAEREWQNNMLTQSVREMAIELRNIKEKSFRDLL